MSGRFLLLHSSRSSYALSAPPMISTTSATSRGSRHWRLRQTRYACLFVIEGHRCYLIFERDVHHADSGHRRECFRDDVGAARTGESGVHARINASINIGLRRQCVGRLHRLIGNCRTQRPCDGDLCKPASSNRHARRRRHLRRRYEVAAGAYDSAGCLPWFRADCPCHGHGAEVQKSLATVVIGGLVTATILTLIVLSALYK